MNSMVTSKPVGSHMSDGFFFLSLHLACETRLPARAATLARVCYEPCERLVGVAAPHELLVDNGITVVSPLNTVGDAGEAGLLLFNMSDMDVTLPCGAMVARLVELKVFQETFRKVPFPV